jgi:hypothetical protein
VPRRLFLATQQRIAIPWRENISKKNGEMSNNFREIIKKPYFLV